jgi:hypothetical protein
MDFPQKPARGGAALAIVPEELVLDSVQILDVDPQRCCAKVLLDKLLHERVAHVLFAKVMRRLTIILHEGPEKVRFQEFWHIVNA